MYKSYYFEWPIEQIRDVGLSIINQERNLLKQGKTLQNANPYNVTGNALSCVRFICVLYFDIANV